jgi:uncharacterized protein (TIGR02996 family)
MTLDAFLQAMIDDPRSASTTWQVLADWLEEQNDPRSKLVRLMYQPDYRRDLPAEERDERVRELLASGVGPVAPTLINSLGMKLVLIPAGTFMMGSPDGEGDRDEHPRHEVEITRPFFLGAFQVTQEEYERVVGSNPSFFNAGGVCADLVKNLDTRQFPVENVSRDEARAFCEALSEDGEEQAAGRTYRLPTEAEWEYACRGGAATSTPFHFGKSLSSTQANVDGRNPYGGSAKEQYLERPCPVGSYPANGFGLFDMHGNVWEWCLDWYGENYYTNSPKMDPQGPVHGDRGVLRGGAWTSYRIICRSACRYTHAPYVRNGSLGFRVCCLWDF